MSMAANGSGILTTGGTGNITFSNTVAQDLTAVTNLTGFRTRQQGVGSSYMELDTVTISAIPEPSAAALIGGALALASVMISRRR